MVCAARARVLNAGLVRVGRGTPVRFAHLGGLDTTPFAARLLPDAAYGAT
jgi:hypothetical protein